MWALAISTMPEAAAMGSSVSGVATPSVMARRAAGSSRGPSPPREGGGARGRGAPGHRAPGEVRGVQAAEHQVRIRDGGRGAAAAVAGGAGEGAGAARAHAK